MTARAAHDRGTMEQNQDERDPGPAPPPDPRRDARAAVLHLAQTRAALGDRLIAGGINAFESLLRAALQEEMDLDLVDAGVVERCARTLVQAALDADDPELRAALLAPGGGLLGAMLDRLAPRRVPPRLDPVTGMDAAEEVRALLEVLGVDPSGGWHDAVEAATAWRKIAEQNDHPPWRSRAETAEGQLVELGRALGVEVQDPGAPGVAAALAACALAAAPTDREAALRSVLVEVAAALGIEGPADTLDRRGPRGLLDRCLLAAGHMAGQAQRHRDEGARALVREVLERSIDPREDRSPADLLRDEIREARALAPGGRAEVRALDELQRVARRLLPGHGPVDAPEAVVALGGLVHGRACELQSGLVEVACALGVQRPVAAQLVVDDPRALLDRCERSARSPVHELRARAEAAEAQLASARAAAGLPESGGDLALAVASLVEAGIADEDQARARGALDLAREVLGADEIPGSPADALRDALDRAREGAVARSVSESEPSAWRGAALQLAADLEVRVAGDADPPDLLRALVLGVVGEAARCVSDAWPALGLPVDANPGDLARHVSTLREDLASAAARLGADDLEGAGALELAREVGGRVARVVEHLVAAGAALDFRVEGASALTAAAHVRRVVEERASRTPDARRDGAAEDAALASWAALGLPASVPVEDLPAHAARMREDLAAALAALGRLAKGKGAVGLAAELRELLESRRLDHIQPEGGARSPFRVSDARKFLAVLHQTLSGQAPEGKFDVDAALREACESVARLQRRVLAIAGDPPSQHLHGAVSTLEALVPAGALAEAPAMAATGWVSPEVAGAARGHLLDLVAALNARGVSTQHQALALDALAERALDHARLLSRAGGDPEPLVLGLPRDQADALCRALVGTSFDGPDAARETVVAGVALARADLLAALDALSPGDADAWAHAGVDALSRRVRGLADGSARPCWDGTDLGDAVQVLARAVGLADAERGSGAEAVRRLAGEVERARRDLEASAEALDLDLPALTLPGAAAHLRARAQDLRDALLRMLELSGAVPAPDGVRVEHALEDELRGQAGTLGEVLAQLGDEDSLEDCALRDVCARVLSRAHDHASAASWATRAQAALQRLDLRLAEEAPGLVVAPERSTCARDTPTADDLLDDKEGLDSALRALDQRASSAEHDFDRLDELLPDGWDLRRLLLDVLVPHAADEPTARRVSLTSEEFCERLVLAYEDQLRGPGAYAEVGPVARRDRALALGAALEKVLD
jgi:hypothetical protein